jgi:hypothetical protein
MAILDMTDIDSVALSHRDVVERLMPEVDVVMWVLDPVKYSDPVLHGEFIAPLATAADRLIFVLNKVDQVDEVSLDRIMEHLGRLLRDDGIREPTLFEVAADPPGSEPRGVEAIAAHLTARFDEKKIHVSKIIDDARRAAQAVAGAAGVAGGGSLEFEERWLVVREAIVAGLVADGGAAAFEEALRLLEGFILRLSTEAGGVFGVRIRQGFRGELIETELRAVQTMAHRSSDVGRVLDDGLQERFGAPLRTLLWERASLSAVVAGLAVDASMVDQHLGRHVP